MKQDYSQLFKLIGIDILDIHYNQQLYPVQVYKTFEFTVRIEHHVNFIDYLFIVICTTHILNESRTIQLATKKAQCVFDVSHISEYYETIYETWNFPEELLKIFNSVTISTMRGIMFSQFRGTFLNDAILPVINPSSVTVN